MRPETAIAEIINIAPNLNKDEWSLFQSIFEHTSKSSPVFHLIKPSLSGIQTATEYVNHILTLDIDESQIKLINDILSHPNNHWSEVRMVLAIRAHQIAKAMRLHEYAQTIHQLEGIFNRLLSSSEEEVIDILSSVSLTDIRGGVLIDLINAYVHLQPDTSQLLSQALSTQNAQREIEQLFRLPQSHIESKINHISTTFDKNSWNQFLLILQHKSQHDLVAKQALEYTLQVRSSMKESELKLRCRIEDALSDGQITYDEQREINDLGTQLGLPLTNIDQLVKEELEAYMHQQSIQHKLRQKIQIILEDGIITPDEHSELDALREDLAVTSDLVDRLLQEARQQHAKSSSATNPRTTTDDGIAFFRRSIHHVLQDNVITSQEGAALEALRQRLRITAEQARQILLDVQSERSSNT